MARSGGQPTAALAITCTSFPVRRGFKMTRRSYCVHNPKNPSCFHRLRISFFFSSTRSSFPCLPVAVSYKSGRICAQLRFSVPQFNLRRSLYSLLPTSFIVFASRSFFPVDSLFVSMPSSGSYLQARPDLRSATTFRSTIPSSPISLLFISANLTSFSHIAIFLVDSFFHYGILPSSLPSVHQRPLVFVCCRKLSRAP